MAYQHSIFLFVSGVSYLLLLLDTGIQVTGIAEISRISLMVIGGLLLSSLLLHRKSVVQLRSLRVLQSIVVVVTGVYYYFMWVSDGFSQWFGIDGSLWGFLISGILPILGYGFLSVSVRILHRNLKLVRNVDRLRG